VSDNLNTDTQLNDVYAVAGAEAEMLDKEERRSSRIKDCGKFAWWFDPHTGEKQGYYRYCEVYRECQTCLERRAQKEKELMMNIVTSCNVMITRVEDKSEGNKFVRNTKASKSQYVRYPLEDGSEIIFFDGDELPADGAKINLEWVLEENWEEIVCQPEGRNRSGKMHMPESPGDKEEYTMINSYQLVAEAPNGVVANMMDEVVEETAHMNPETPEEVQRDLFTRFLELQRKLRDSGFKSRTYPKKVKVVHSKINWQVNSCDINYINTKNLTYISLEPLDRPPI
jgi:hypothetical protein